jgi:hypothetical protein
LDEPLAGFVKLFAPAAQGKAEYRIQESGVRIKTEEAFEPFLLSSGF